jgi:putative membrane protein
MPAYEAGQRLLNTGRVTSALLAFQFILASSAVYEMLEWAITLILAPELAAEYNGQQGDMWDAQKDMALAALGSLLVLLISAIGAAQPHSAHTARPLI